MTSVFGEIFVASTLKVNMRDTIIKWFPSYLRHVEREVGWEREPLDVPYSYENRDTFEVESGEQMPKCVIISPGLYDVPQVIEGDGYYTATWQIGVGIAIAAPSEEEAVEMTDMYAAALRALVLHKLCKESDKVERVWWLGESYEDIPTLDNQLMLYRGATNDFAVTVEKVVNRWGGPQEPTEEAQVLGEVESTTIEINEEITVANPN